MEKGRKIISADVSLIEGDMENVDGFADKLGGMDVLIHAAACYSEFYRTGDKIRPHETNVNGTVALLKAAHQHGIRKAVYISSSGVLKAEKNQVVDESSPYDEATKDPYFKSKVAAEKEVRKFANDHPDMTVMLLLPSVMLGPGDWGPTPTGNLIILLLKAEFKIILPGSNRIVDARDVALAVIAAIEKGKSGERYLIGGRKYEFSEIYDTLGHVTGRPMPQKSPPPMVLMLISFFMVMKGKFTGKPPALKPSIVRRLLDNFGYDSTKAEKELAIKFRPLSETLSDTAEWFHQQLISEE
jgi:nucleoside-diphosphate-sugar epimerase